MTSSADGSVPGSTRMGAQTGPDAQSQVLRADLWVRMVQSGSVPMPVDAGMRG